MRWLLRADVPVPDLSKQEIQEEVNRNFRWNIFVNFLDGAFFWIGLSFISYTTILPLFISKITLNPLPIALVAVIGQASWYLPQLVVAGPTEKLARMKPVVVNLGFFTERLPMWFMPVAALMSVKYPILALVILFPFVCCAWFGGRRRRSCLDRHACPHLSDQPSRQIFRHYGFRRDRFGGVGCSFQRMAAENISFSDQFRLCVLPGSAVY